MAQSVSYNGFEIPLATVRHTLRPSYDSSNRTMQGYYHVFTVSGIVHGATRTLFSTSLNSFRAAVSQARARFLWKSSATDTLYDIGGEGSGAAVTDRRWGPKPASVDVQEIPGGKSARVTFIIEAFVTACAGAIDLEELTWVFSYQLDRNFTMTRSISGRARFQSAVDVPLTVLQNEAYWPVVPPGFYREGVSHQLSADGLEITFNITDRQVWRTLPQPLTDGNATFNIEQRGASVHKTLSGSFSAPLDVPKQTIAQFIIALIKMRFPHAINIVGGAEFGDVIAEGGIINEYFVQFNITNHEFDNRMDFTVVSRGPAAAFKNPGGDDVFIPATLFGDVADVLPGGADDWTESSGESELRGPTGTAGIIPKIGDPFDVCTVLISPEETTDEDQATFTKDDTVGKGGNKGSSLNEGDEPIVVSAEHQQFPYTSYVESHQYIRNTNVAVLNVLVDKNKSTGVVTPQVVQQTARPTIKIIQIGMARRMGIPPTIPGTPTFGGASNVHVLQQDVRTEAPAILADGTTLEHKAAWSFIYQVVDSFTYANNLGEDSLTTATGINIPRNQQLAASHPHSYNDTLILNIDEGSSPNGDFDGEL